MVSLTRFRPGFIESVLIRSNHRSYFTSGPAAPQPPPPGPNQARSFSTWNPNQARTRPVLGLVLLALAFYLLLFLNWIRSGVGKVTSVVPPQAPVILLDGRALINRHPIKSSAIKRRRRRRRRRTWRRSHASSSSFPTDALN